MEIPANYTIPNIAKAFAEVAAKRIKTSYSSAKEKMTSYAASAASNMISTIQKMEDKYMVIKQSASSAFARIIELAGNLKDKIVSNKLGSALSDLSSKVSNLFKKQVQAEQVTEKDFEPEFYDAEGPSPMQLAEERRKQKEPSEQKWVKEQVAKHQAELASAPKPGVFNKLYDTLKYAVTPKASIIRDAKQDQILEEAGIDKLFSETENVQTLD